MERLEQAGLADDTIVVITSDHGELLGERGLMLHKYTVHSALSRVPFLVSWPGHLAPGREDAPISVADALPLVVSLGDIPLDPTVRAALEARPTTRIDGVVTEFNAVADGSLKRMGKLHPEADLSRLERTFQAIEHGPHKFVEASDGSRELYEILADPQEDHDVVSRDAATAAELSDLLRTWRDAVPAYAPSGQAPAKDLSPELRQGLEALGYMD
jgi:choline-sulfatase